MIMKHSQKKERAAKDIFSEMRAHHMIEQGADDNWRLSQNNVG